MDLGFQMWQSKVYSVPSTWKQKRELANHGSQTDEITSDEKGVQSTSTKETEIQTDPEVERPFSAEEYEKFPPSLFAFFSRVTDPICNYLEENCDPFGAEVFQVTGDTESVSERSESVKEYSLRSDRVPSEFIGSCLGWSKTGSRIAIGYSFPSHETWCSHKAPLSSWHMDRVQSFQENVPTAEILLPSCICCMEFHPMDSSIIAVGLFTGEVALVDLFSIEKGSLSGYSTSVATQDFDEWTKKSNSNPTSFFSDFGYTSHSSGHNSPVVEVKWIRLTSSQFSDILQGSATGKDFGDPIASSYCCLLTASKDGFICLWSTNTANNRLKLVKRFIVWADNLPEDVKIGNRNVNGMKEVGVTGLSCCKDDPFAFLFSTFGSYLFQGNLLSDTEAYEAESILQDSLAFRGSGDMIFSPSPVLLCQQEGYNTALDCSPFHRNVFLCATGDGRIFLKNLLQPSVSLKELRADEDSRTNSNGISDAQWSARPMVFGVTSGSTLKLFDLLVGESPVASIDHDCLLTKLAFNKSGNGVVAVCDEKGWIHIWKLSSKLINQDPREIEQFIEATKISSGI